MTHLDEVVVVRWRGGCVLLGTSASTLVHIVLPLLPQRLFVLPINNETCVTNIGHLITKQFTRKQIFGLSGHKNPNIKMGEVNVRKGSPTL